MNTDEEGKDTMEPDEVEVHEDQETLTEEELYFVPEEPEVQ